MLDSRNFGSLTCGIVADPETAADGKLLKLRLAADWAGSNSEDREDRRGYFDGLYWLNAAGNNAEFVKKQMAEGNLKKGSQIQVLYRLSQSRYLTKEGAKASRVELVIESINYASSSRPESAGDGAAKPTASVAGDSPLPNQF